MLAVGICVSLLPYDSFAEETIQEKATAKDVDVEETAEPLSAKEADDDPGQFRLGGSQIQSFATSAPSFANYTQPSKYSGYTVQNGIDVSKYQETINWTKVKNAGIQFAIIRVGYRGYQTGSLAEDPCYAQNLQGCTSAGIPIGVYMFSQAVTTAEAEAEAEYILERIKGYPISLPVVMDYEFAGGSTGRLKAAGLSKAAATNICNAFCDKVKAAGYTPMVYADKNMLTNYLNASGLTSAVWLAHYTSRYQATDYAGDFDYWQFTSSGQVSGINGNVDLNFRYVKDGTTATAQTSSPSVTPLSGTGTTNGTSINVREGPGASYKKLTTLRVNKKVALTGKIDGWYQVVVSINGTNKTGYIKECYITQIGKPTLSSATAKSKSKIKIKWSKVPKASGYEIQRKTSGGSYKTIKTIKGKATVAYANTGLKKNKTYTYRVRAYKKVNGRKIYGYYSSAKSAKTKKK